MSLRNSLRQSVTSFPEKCCTVAGYRGCNNATNQLETATAYATTHATTPMKPSNDGVIGATPHATTVQQALKNRATTVQQTATKVARVNPQTDHIPEPGKAEKLHELDLLIQYIASANDFSKTDTEEAKRLAAKDVELALTSFRALSRDIRRDRVLVEILRANPDVPRAVYTDIDSDPLNRTYLGIVT